MAKERIEIDTRPAVESLKQLKKSLDQYKLSVNQLAGIHKNAEKHANQFKTAIFDVNERLKDTKTVIGQVNRTFGSLDTKVSSAAKAMGVLGRSGRSIGVFVTNIKDANKALSGMNRRLDTYLQRLADMNSLTRTNILLNDRAARSMLRLIGQFHDLERAVNTTQRRFMSLNRHMDMTQVVSRQTSLLHKFNAALQRSAHILFNFLGYGSLFRVFAKAEESIGRAYELAKAISEIRTISDRAAVSTEEWQRQLFGLSNSFGIDVLEAAEANYQALSNQVVEAKDSMSFLRTEMVTAYTTVSDLTDVVEATTGILNAWKESSAAATRVNAILFKTIEEGRVRMDEMANTLGRVSILSSRLNISFIEQQASLSQLTKLGLKYDEAVTAMRNVQLKLVRPTEHMSELLNQWGFDSGAAAVKALGLTGVMRKLYLETLKSRDASEEMGDIFQELRGIIGALGLTQSDLSKEVELYTTAVDDNFEAFLERIKSIDTRANVQLQKFQNTLQQVFGEPILKRLVEMAEAFGDLDTIFMSFVHNLRRVIEAVIAFRIATATLNATFFTHDKLMQRLILRYGLFSAVVIKTRRAMMALAITQGLTTAGLTLAIGGLLEFFLSSNDASENAKLAGEKFQQALEKVGSISLERAKTVIAKDAIAMAFSIEMLTKELNIFFAKLNIVKNEFADAANFDKLIKGFEEFSKEINKVLEGPLDKLEDKINKLDRSIESLKENITKEQIALNVDTELKAAGGDVSKLQEYYQDLINQSLTITDPELFDTVSAQADRVFAEIQSRLQELDQEAKASLKERQAILNEAARESLADDQAAMNDLMRQQFGVDDVAKKSSSQLKRQMRKMLEEQNAAPKLKHDETQLTAELAALEEQRLKIEEQRLQHKRDIVKLQETEALALRKQKEEQQKSVLALQGVFDEIAQLKSEGMDFEKLQRLGDLRQQVLNLGADAGLTTDKQFEVIQEIANFELEARKLIEQKIQEEKLTQGRNTLDKLAKHAEQANQKVEEGRTRVLEFQTTDLNSLIGGDVGNFMAMFEKAKNARILGMVPTLPNLDISKHSFKAMNDLANKLKGYQGQAEPLTPKQLKDLEESLQRARMFFEDLKIMDTETERYLNAQGLIKHTKGKRGEDVVTIAGEDISVIQKRFEDAASKLKELKILQQESSTALQDFNLFQQELKNYLQTIPDDMKTFTDKADELLDKPIQSTEEWLEKLREVKTLIEDVKNLQAGRVVVGPNGVLQPGNVEYNTYSTRIDRIEIRPQRVSDAEVNELLNRLERRDRQQATVSRGN